MVEKSYLTMLKEIAKDAHVSVAQTELVLGAFYNWVAKSLRMGYRTVITGFGVFFVKNGEVCFKPSKRLLVILNS